MSNKVITKNYAFIVIAYSRECALCFIKLRWPKEKQLSHIFYKYIERDIGSLLKLIVISDYYGLKLGRNYCRFV